ncbi:MAG: D-sedoheptulose 7-phosphate isomerase [Chitinophagaceae bacterium]|nr:D-sedoheptulose 7-phosphate isomerase [Chitinophagaceae bacterium]
MDIQFLQSKIQASIDLKSKLIQDQNTLQTVIDVCNEIIQCYSKQGKVLWCGNGGSAADAQHLSAELTGRFYYDRQPLSSEALHVNTSYITAVANDYSYEQIYARLIKGVGKPGDILIGLSTSGNSGNVMEAFKVANEMGMITVGLTGNNGGKMKDVVKYLIDIPSTDTPRIQECHMLLGHSICEIVESTLFPKP